MQTLFERLCYIRELLAKKNVEGVNGRLLWTVHGIEAQGYVAKRRVDNEKICACPSTGQRLEARQEEMCQR